MLRIHFDYLALLLPVALTGCGVTPTASTTAIATVSLKGSIHSGVTPLVGAHIYLLAANTTGYGQASVSLLTVSATGNSDSVGAYVASDSSGNFSIPSGFTCGSTTQVYLYAQGGNAGASVNSAAGMLAAVGACPAGSNSAPSSYAINEVSTVATAYAISGFTSDATHVSSSGTPLAVADVANAFANTGNLYAPTTATPLSTTPAGNGTVPSKMINTLADILAACIKSAGPASTPCTTLFSNAHSQLGTTPTDTASAAINIAHSPGANISALFGLAAAGTPFTPALTTAPNDFTLGINFTGAGLNQPFAAAIDAQGNAWFTNLGDNSVSKLSPLGAPLTSAQGNTNGTPKGPVGIAFDLSGDAWVVNAVNSSLTKYDPSGALLSPLSPTAGYTGGGLAIPQGLACDGLGNIWVVNYGNDSVSNFSGGGLAISPATGYQRGGILGPVAIAVDSSGAVWVANTKGAPNSVSKLTSSGQPISPPNGFTGGGIQNPFSIAIDSGGNAWVADFDTNSVSKLTTNGNPVSPSTGYKGGGLSLPYSLAIDGGGNVWIANSGLFSVSELANDGTPLSPTTGFQGGLLNAPQAIVVDGSGNVWIANSNDISVTEFVGASVPVVTPIAVGVRNNTLGVRP